MPRNPGAAAACLTTHWHMELAAQLINEAPTDEAADKAVDWYAELLRNSRRFAWARTIAREHSRYSGQ
jgi:hypothetical protein